jgi:hypothetical protein
MDIESRIASLEQEILRQKAVLQEFGTLIQEAGGEQNILFAAALALVESSQNPHVLGPILRREIGTVEAIAVSQAQSEGQVSGAQAAHTDFLRALETAGKNFGST